MNKFKLGLTLMVLAVSQLAHATLPTLILKNQFGEQSNNTVIGGTCSLPASATHTILSNLTGGTATAIANTYAAVSAVLLPTQLLTGYTSGAGTVAGTDTVLQAIQKLNGNDALALPKAGGTMSGAIAMGTSKITGLGSATADTDAASQGNVKTLIAARILVFTSSAGSGGAATEAMTVTGLLSTDTILAVSQSVKGANSLPLIGYNTLANNALTGVWSADPGANSVIKVAVLR